ncbi:MAG: hypothetical protein IIY73_06370 [Solobacterium sp.]|nr:hypothetical protein [Solobacterium sp.]MBQ1447139.1 hypothetical protein [Solobacterium sp.]
MENRNNTIRSFLSILLKSALALALFAGVWYVLTPLFRLDRNIDGDQYRNLPENTLDVLCLGSSHIQYSFSPAVFYAETGLYSYVLGSPCQPVQSSYAVLDEALKTQNPSVVIMDVFTLLPQSEVCYADGLFYKALDMTTGKTRAEAAEAVPNEEMRTAYRYDLIMNHDNWKRMDLKELGKILENARKADGFNENLGFVPMEVTDPVYMPLITYDTSETVELSSDDILWLDRIVNRCRDEGIVLILMKSPFIIDQENTNILHAVWQYAESRNVEYVDFIAEASSLNWFIGMDGDTWHNNVWGAEIITKELARRIQTEHPAASHRENAVWESLLQKARSKLAGSLMNDMNVDPYRLLDEAAKYPSIAMLAYHGRGNTTIGPGENDLLNRAGFAKDFIHDFSTDYYAVAVQGELIQAGSAPFTIEYNGAQIRLASDGIYINGESVCGPGEMQLVFAAPDYSWTNSIPINYASRWFWKNGCDGFDCTVGW